MGSDRIGGPLVKRADFFVNVAMRAAMRRRQLTPVEREMYKRPHPTPESRVPLHVLPQEWAAAHDWLAEIEQGLKLLADKPMVLVWGDRDPAFRQHQMRRWERAFPNHRTHILHGAGHYIQEDAPDEIVAVIKEWAPPPSSP
jgi:haloalkane dehalogenase